MLRCDWSSHVCSSNLHGRADGSAGHKVIFAGPAKERATVNAKAKQQDEVAQHDPQRDGRCSEKNHWGREGEWGLPPRRPRPPRRRRGRLPSLPVRSLAGLFSPWGLRPRPRPRRLRLPPRPSLALAQLSSSVGHAFHTARNQTAAVAKDSAT